MHFKPQYCLDNICTYLDNICTYLDNVCTYLDNIEIEQIKVDKVDFNILSTYFLFA